MEGHILWNVLCLCHDGRALLRFWFQTKHGCENSASYLKVQVGKTFSYPGHALFLCSDWSKFDRWVHAENLCSILKLVDFDSWSWQSFLSIYDVFNCLFPLDVQNEIQLLSRACCLLFFGWEMRHLSVSEIRPRMASFSFFTLFDAY